jgi:hypothetical protein
VNAAAKQQEEIENMLKVAKKFMDYKELGLIQPGRKIIMEGNMYASALDVQLISCLHFHCAG